MIDASPSAPSLGVARAAADLSLPLLERERELAVLRWRLLEARNGRGGVVLIEGPIGHGKSSLLRASAALAGRIRLRLLWAHGRESERGYPFSGALQLLAPLAHAANGGAPHHPRLGGRNADEQLAGHHSGWGEFALIRSLFTRLCDVTGGPGRRAAFAALIDDAHALDRPTLRFLAYLANRVESLPIALLVAVGQGREASDTAPMRALRHAAGEAALRLRPLTPGAVDALVARALADTDRELGEACAAVTGGNPLLLTKLLEAVRARGLPPGEDLALALERLAGESAREPLLNELIALPAEQRALTTAFALLADHSPLRRAAALAGLDPERACRAADALVAQGLLAPGAAPRLASPVLRRAVEEGLPPHERAEAHRRAALILLEEDAAPERVARHLLAAPPAGDPRVTACLRTAAGEARARGDALAAATLLARAVAEGPSAGVGAELLAELAEVAVEAGLPEAAGHLEAALAATTDPVRLAQLALLHARLLSHQRLAERAAATLRRAREQLPAAPSPGSEEARLARALDAAYLREALTVPELVDTARERGRELAERVAKRGEASGPERSALARLALHESLGGAPRESVRRLSELAWSGSALLDVDEAGWQDAALALEFVDELEAALSICERARASAERGRRQSERAAALAFAAFALYEQGRVAEARERAACATAALEVAAPDAQLGRARALAQRVLALCAARRGELEDAEAALSVIESLPDRSLELALLLEARATLRLIQHQPAAALEDALAASRCASELAIVNPGAVSWRSTAALAQLALGERESAQRLAEEGLRLARRTGVNRAILRNLRVIGLAAERGGAALLAEAAGAKGPMRLEHILAALAYGATLRRANRRVDAREPLRKALDLSYRAGALALMQQARTELLATGARPRREARSGIESLTPSERRVAELAARGLTTRSIAAALFVTPKTVEFHLGHVYRKLDVSSRRELTAAWRR